ncbi:MAG: prolyl oligopeptidase family serine peptidase [Planctomycetaceae bacterium]
MLGVGCSLVNQHLANYMIWDAIRALDYLQTREEIDFNRVAAFGNSGGGMQSAYLMALEERLFCAVASCYFTTLPQMLSSSGPQDAEQHFFCQSSEGFQLADFLISFAPKPVLIGAARQDYFPFSGTEEIYQDAKKAYQIEGQTSSIELSAHDHRHGLHPPLLTACCKWLTEQLTDHAYQEFPPESLPRLDVNSAQCTLAGQTMLLPGAKSVYDMNLEVEAELERQREQHWQTHTRESNLETIRKLARISPYNEITTPHIEQRGSAFLWGYRLTRFDFQVEPGITLNLLWCEANSPAQGVTIYLHPQGISEELQRGSRVHRLLSSGHSVLILEPRGTGSNEDLSLVWKHRELGPEAQGATLAYLTGRTYTGMQTDDVQALLKAIAAGLLPVEIEKESLFTLEAYHELTIPALHAAALHAERFNKVILHEGLDSWSCLLSHPVPGTAHTHTVQRALTVYDLPDLKQILGEKLIEQAEY